MNDILRVGNAWVQAALWLVAVAFAAFLIGLGGKVLERLWDVEPPVTLQQFIHPAQGASAQQLLRQADADADAVRLRLEQARHKLGVAKINTVLAKENFDVWIAARSAAARPDQDAELLIRTSELDQVRMAQQAALTALQAQEKALLHSTRQREDASRRWLTLERAALSNLAQARWMQQMRVFLHRLAVTTPLVLLACWLFLKKRHSTWWPFIWGYIFFAAFTFFVELVPHVPSYSGAVRYVVGIIITVLVGRFAILALQEARADEPGALHVSAASCLANATCPGCAHEVDLHNPAHDFCTHCGMHLFHACHKCKTRKAAFTRFCLSCGTSNVPGEPAG